MRYIVMEAHLGYAIVLDQQGAFKKVVNKGYEIGQEIEEIIYFEEIDERKKRRVWKTNVSVIAAAACFCLVLLGAYQQFMIPFGTVRMTINPDVVISVNKHDYVLDVDGMNEDGEILIDGYRYNFKKLEEVSDDLVDRAIEQGFLAEGGEVVIEIESKDENWKKETEQKLIDELKTHTKEEVEVMTGETKKEKSTQQKDESIVIDVNDDSNSSSNVSSEKSEYDDSSDYGGSSSSNYSDYDSSDYGSSSNNSPSSSSSGSSNKKPSTQAGTGGGSGNSSNNTSSNNSDYASSDYENTTNNSSNYESSDDNSSNYDDSSSYDSSSSYADSSDYDDSEDDDD